MVVPRTNGASETTALLLSMLWFVAIVCLGLTSMVSSNSSRIRLSVTPGVVSVLLLPRYLVTTGALDLSCVRALGATW